MGFIPIGGILADRETLADRFDLATLGIKI